MLAALFALYTRQYVIGMLILIYCQIQLAEAIIWRGIDTDNTSLNRIGTFYAKYTLPAHLLFVGIGISMMKNCKKDIKNIILGIGIVFYLSILFYYTLPSSTKDYISTKEKGLSFPSNRACMKRECQNNENRLQWPFKDSYYIIQTIIVYILFIKFLPLKSSILFTAFFTLTFVCSKIMYKWSTSSIWCFLSAVLAPVLVILNYYIIKNKEFNK